MHQKKIPIKQQSNGQELMFLAPAWILFLVTLPQNLPMHLGSPRMLVCNGYLGTDIPK